PMALLTHLIIGVLEACILQDLSRATRRILIAMTTPVVASMTIYFLAPLTLLEYCDKIQAEAHASLPDILEDGVLVARPDGPNMDRDRSSACLHTFSFRLRRLRKLDERKLRAAHAIWGMSRNPIWHRIVSFWWLFTTLRLFYDYYVM
ncbi:hypothetical protein BD626DRAFT_352132, partial [Schizophyllum amplum]